jgi:hypothetical protein
LNALVLTYAVATHRLVDVRVVFRKALVNIVLYGGGVVILLTLFRFFQWVFGFEFSFASLAVAIGLGIPAVLFLARKLRDPWAAKVEQAFTGARYSYRKQLSEFLTKIDSVPTLEQFGSEFIFLLSKSIDCRQACLLFPQSEEGLFRARFVYPPTTDNPMGQLKLRQDSPIVAWLKRERTILPETSFSVLPEFQSMWRQEKEELRLVSL